MYIVKTGENSDNMAYFAILADEHRPLLSHYLRSLIADDSIIRTFSITPCIQMEHYGL